MVEEHPALAQLEHLDAPALRELVVRLQRDLRHKQALNDKLTHEMAVLKRLKFAARSESYRGEAFPTEQRSLLEEAIDADLEAMALELEALNQDAQTAQTPKPKDTPRRAPLPAHLPRVRIAHEPESTVCTCGCALRRVGEDVAEKLDYAPGVFTVEQHVRGKWACAHCQTLIQAPVPAHVIDKGIPTTGLLAQVLVAKYADHLPLYRQEGIFERAGMAIARSTLAQWIGACGVQLQPVVDALKAEMLSHTVLHADETPVAMLSPGKGKTQRSYLWTYCAGAFENIRAVVYDFNDSRSGEHARTFLGDWRGKLLTDDFSGYKALHALGVTELGCMAHARRKFFDLHVANKSALAQEALQRIVALYEIEREVQLLEPPARLQIRQSRSRPLAEALHVWMTMQRTRVSEGSAMAKALDYSLRRWAALTRYLDDPQVPIDNNWCENQIRPIAVGRHNWLFAGSLRAGKRAAAVMSLIQSAKMNGIDPHAYLKDVLTRLPTLPNSRIAELLPHRWTPGTDMDCP